MSTLSIDRQDALSVRTLIRWLASGVLPAPGRAQSAQRLLLPVDQGQLTSTHEVLSNAYSGVLASEVKCAESQHELAVLLERLDSTDQLRSAPSQG